MPQGFLQFVENARQALKREPAAKRDVYVSDIKSSKDKLLLSGYIADRAPLFYRNVDKIVSRLQQGYALTALAETLAKLPTSESFRSSHFGEICSGIFAEEVLGVRRLYSKLALLTAENSNAYKMDLVLCRPMADPVEIIFGQVKSSPKITRDGSPAKHDTSCYSDVFRSMNEYLEKDLEFDLTAANDNLQALPEPEATRVRAALMPYSNVKIVYAAFAVIDSSTKSLDEARVLANRICQKTFDVDLICLEGYADIANATYDRLAKFK